jgi:hypothetical protein
MTSTDTPAKMMYQVAPYPTILADLVARLHMERGWSASLVDTQRDEDHGRGESSGLTLIFTAYVEDTYHRGEHFPINHLVIVPAATYNEASWQRWLFDAYCNVRLHENMENFAIEDPSRCRHCGASADADGDHSCTCPLPDEECTRHPAVYLFRPYAPNHGPGENVYVVRELTTDVARRTQYTGGLDHNRARPEGR